MKRVFGLFFGLMALSLAGCGGSSSEVRKGAINYVNTLVGVTVDVLVDGSTRSSGLGDLGFTSFDLFDEGNRTVSFRNSTSGAILTSQVVNVSAPTSYTVVAYGTAASPQSLTLVDDRSDVPAGQVRLRLGHASPSAGTVDVYLLSGGQNFAAASPTYSNLTLGQVTAYQLVPAGNYAVTITKAGTKTALFPTQTLGFSSGQVRTVFAVDGAGGGTPLRGLILFDQN